MRTFKVNAAESNTHAKTRKIGARLRRAALGAAAVSAMLAAGGTALADYALGVAAYNKGEVEQAIDIWKRGADFDVQSKKILGDIYSRNEDELKRVLRQPTDIVQEDNVDALVWYTLAAFHPFTGYKAPSAEERNAQILADGRLRTIRGRMSTADVKKAEKRVSSVFEAGSPFEIYTLGTMYQQGAGVSKDNTKALQMFQLAKERGVGEASADFERLEPLMSPKEVKLALERATDWQPPLPNEHKGKTPQQKELERLKKELEELKLEEALEAVVDIDVVLIQRALRALGFYQGSLDNKVGPETRAAIRRFQYSQVRSNTQMTADEKEARKTGELSARQTVSLFREAAKKEHPMSQYVYGVMHARGIGVAQDGAAAVKWLGKAAGEDLAIAHYALGVLYRDGSTGLNEITPDKAQAAFHFSNADSLGYSQAGKELRKLKFEDPRYVD
ncbi:MAG: peptidoglycan-binding protein [Pseudomonadota bacterium]